MLITDSTFANTYGNDDVSAVYTWGNTTVLGTTFVGNQGSGVYFRPRDTDNMRCRMANTLLLGNGSGYDVRARGSADENAILLKHTVIGSCSPNVARLNIWVVGKDNWTSWFLNVKNGQPQPQG